MAIHLLIKIINKHMNCYKFILLLIILFIMGFYYLDYTRHITGYTKHIILVFIKTR